MDLDRARVEDFETVALDDVLTTIPGWTSPNERKFNKWVLRELYTGTGDVVDLGCLYGSMTLSMALGLVENPRGLASGRKIHAYDRFLHPPMSDRLLPGAKVGESSKDTFLGYLGPWIDHIDIHAGDATEIGWSGQPIEYLFVDVMKTIDVARKIALAFFPHLLPGQSLLVHQDFKHYYTHWIHVMMFRLRDHFAPYFDVPVAASFVFRPLGPVDTDAINASCDYSTLGLDEIDAVFEYSERFLGPDVRRWRVRAAKMMALLSIHEGGPGLDPSGVALESALRVHASLPEAFLQDYEFESFNSQVQKYLDRDSGRNTDVTTHG